MNQQPTKTGQLDQCLDQFEQAWQSGTAPEIDQFLAGLEDQWKNWDQSTRSKLLEELIKLDLDYRWHFFGKQRDVAALSTEEATLVAHSDQSKRWLLEDYLRQHPELASSGKLPMELILEEYRIRQMCGDSPSHQEYVKRFPDHGQDLPERLAQIDSDLPDQADTESSQQTASATITAEPLASGRFGDYELLDEIARGGMGVVYRARQISLNRTVAVKMILAGQLASEEDIRRFRTESEAAAKLQHPHIVTIHEVGELKDQHYFSMDFIEGESLADQVAGGPLPVEQAAELVSTVAKAIDYAHQQGILHRDLKPQNILIDSSQQPQVTDFGLAKRIEGRSDLTGTGQILGTPSYMPPEQAGSDPSAVGPASDIYSLGAILYELVTGRPPFQAQTPLETLMQVLSQEPVAPRLLNASVPRDLETIILKCLEKQPSKRYVRAVELSEELARYLEGKPIEARPVGAWERTWRWCRRKPALAGMWALAAVLLLTLSIGGPMVAVQLSKNTLLREISVTKGQEARSRLVQMNVANGERHLRSAELRDAVAWFAEAMKLYNGDMAGERVHRLRLAILLRQTPRIARVWTHKSAVIATSISANGRRVLTASGDRAYVWDLVTGNLIAEMQHPKKTVVGEWFSNPLVFPKTIGAWMSPDGRWVVTATWSDRSAWLWDTAGEKPIGRKLALAHPISLSTFPYLRGAFSLDSQHLAMTSSDGHGKGAVRLWKVSKGEHIFEREYPGSVSSIAFGPRGKTFMADGGNENAAFLWNIADGKLLRKYELGTSLASSVFSPDGLTVFAGGFGLARLWHVGTGEKIWEQSYGYPEIPFSHLTVTHGVFSPDGRLVAITVADTNPFNSEGRVDVLDALTGSVKSTLKLTGKVTDISFSPDSRYIITAKENTVRFWDVKSGEFKGPSLTHDDRVYFASFTPNGRYVFTAGADGTARLWDVGRNRMRQHVLRHPDPVERVLFSPDGDRIATSAGQFVRIWDADSGTPLGMPLVHMQSVKHLVFSRDGKRLLTDSGSRGVVKVWEVAESRVIAEFNPGKEVSHLAFSPDGNRVVTAAGGKARVWDAVTGQPLTKPMVHLALTFDEGDLLPHFEGVEMRYAEFSLDGRWIVTASGTILGRTRRGKGSGRAQVWDARRGTRIGPPLKHDSLVFHASFSPDGQHVVTAGRKSARVWEVATGEEVFRLKAGAYVFHRATFSSDGNWIVTTALRTTEGKPISVIRVWNARNGRPISRPMRHPGFVTDATLSSDLSFLATSCTDKIVRFWDPITGNLIAVPLGNDREIIAASLSADDSRLVTAEGKTAHVYNVSTDKKPIDELVFLAQTVIGKRIDITQAVSEVDAESLRDGIKRLREKFKEEFTVVTKKIASDDHVEHLLASGTDLASPLRFRNRNGDMVANGLQLRDGDDPWSYIEGATKAGAVVHLGGISESRYANGVLLAIQMKVIRHPFQAIKEPSISITLKTKNAKLIVPLDARLSPTDEARFHIHRTITAYAEGKPRVEVEVDLFDDLIDNGELSLEISGRNSLTLYGLQPSGISLHSLPVVRVREPPSQALPKIEGMRAQSAYTRVLLQIEKTCLEYDKAVFKYLDRDQEKLGVFLEDELRLHLEFADVSNAAQTALNTVSLSEQTAEIWFQKGIIHWIQGETDEAQSCFEQVIKLDKTGFPGAYLALGWSDYAKAQLERASLHMSKVLELDPENPYAFVLLQDISVLLDADFKLKTKASVKQLTQARSMLEGRSALRTLPWRGILPLDKRLEQLIKIENRAPPTSFGF